jgi:PBP1b-binding outer membrane lipoprotein LpoB
MKTLSFVTAVCVSALVFVGCSALMPRTMLGGGLLAPAISAATNDVQLSNVLAQADAKSSTLYQALSFVREVNRSANPTPSSAPIDTVCGMLMTAAAGAGGWYLRHKTPSPTKTIG